MTTDLLVRELPCEWECRQDNGRDVAEGLVVPYDREATVIDELPGGDRIVYRESFVRGAFDRAQRVPRRVSLVYGHSDAFPDRLGYGLSFRDSAEGLVGVFALDRSSADHARDVLTSSHSALSVGFRTIVPHPYSERPGALVVRKAVALAHVAAVTEPAYAGAGITTVRADLLDGDPTDAEVAEETRRAQDAELLSWFSNDVAQKWSHLTGV